MTPLAAPCRKPRANRQHGAGYATAQQYCTEQEVASTIHALAWSDGPDANDLDQHVLDRQQEALWEEVS
jgi:hypothetical protein